MEWNIDDDDNVFIIDELAPGVYMEKLVVLSRLRACLNRDRDRVR